MNTVTVTIYEELVYKLCLPAVISFHPYNNPMYQQYDYPHVVNEETGAQRG